MTEEIFYIPVLPTTGAFLIEELVGDKLDGVIERFEGKSVTISKPLERDMPYKWLRYKERKVPSLNVFYDRNRNSEEPFGLPLTVEIATKMDIPEIWIRKLILHFVDDKWKDRYYTFKNKPITLGSQAEAYVYNYYQKRKNTNWLKQFPRRHLELIDVTGLEKYYWQHRDFLSFLSIRTHGLIQKKKVRRLTGDHFVDEDIEEI